MDTTALAFYYARSGLAKIQLNAFNFPGVAAGVEMSLQVLCRQFLRYGAGQGDNEPGKISD